MGGFLCPVFFYLDTLASIAGCDSVVTVNVTTLNPTAATVTAAACSSYTSPSGNAVWTMSGTYLDTLPNSQGCDSIIPGATAQSFTALANGNYAVIVDMAGCVDTSACETVANIVGIHDPEASDVSVVPNPAHGRVMVSWRGMDVHQVEVWNSWGQRVLVQAVHREEKAALEWTGPAGTYCVVLHREDGRSVIS
jgi:hypothetical protein